MQGEQVQTWLLKLAWFMESSNTFHPLIPMQAASFLAWTPGPTELIIVLVVILILFGPKKLPDLSRAIGKSLGEFKRGRQEVDAELRKLEEDEAEAASESKSDPSA